MSLLLLFRPSSGGALLDSDAEVSWMELEVTLSSEADVSWMEFEVPFLDSAAQVSWIELEVSDVGGGPGSWHRHHLSGPFVKRPHIRGS